MKDTILKNKLDAFFRNISIDIKQYVPDSIYMGSHISRFILNNVRQGLPLKLITDPSSGINSLFIGDKLMMNFITELADYQIETVFYRNKQVIDIPHFQNDMYYIKELLKNITFMEYLLTGNDLYSPLLDIFDSNEAIFTKFVSSNDFFDEIFDIVFNDKNIFIHFYKRDIEITIDRSNNSISFSLDINKQRMSKLSNFQAFISAMNSKIYNQVVRKNLNISPSEFLVQHRELVNIFEY